MGTVQIGILSLRHYLSHLRRGNDFSAAVCGRVYGFKRRSVSGHDGLSALAGGRIGLGLEERRAYVAIISCLNLLNRHFCGFTRR